MNIIAIDHICKGISKVKLSVSFRTSNFLESIFKCCVMYVVKEEQTIKGVEMKGGKAGINL